MTIQEKDIFREALSRIRNDEKFQTDIHTLPFILEGPGINTVLFSDSILRTYLIFNFTIAVLEMRKTVVYLDFDKAFTAFFEDKGSSIEGVEDLIVFNPNHFNLDDILSQICSAKLIDLGLLVFDSITSFYHLSASETDFSTLNRKLGTVMALFKKISTDTDAPIIFTSMVKAKKAVKKGSSVWTTSPAGGRLIQKKSDVILKVDVESSQFLIHILKHPSINLESKTLKLIRHFP